MQTTLSVASGGKKMRNASTVSWKNVCESSDWNWRRIRPGSYRSVATVAEKPASTFWVSNFVGEADRKGQARLKRRTSRKKFRNSVKRVAEWCKQNRHRRVKEQFKLLNAKLRGYYNYYGVNGNYDSLKEFYHLVQAAASEVVESAESTAQLHLGWLLCLTSALRT